MDQFIGLDFGTTNSALAMSARDGETTLARFAHAHGTTTTFRSILFFDQQSIGPGGHHDVFAGPRAIDRYLAASGVGRLLQSLKSFLASPLFTSTNVLGTVFTLEQLIAVLLRQLRTEAEAQFGTIAPRVVFGRPVRFVNMEPDDTDAFAINRLRTAASLAGFEDVVFEFEPVAAAHFYEASLDHDELVLIADFGGGTSDFSLIHVGPGVRRRGRTPAEMLGNEGIGIAGDALDSEIVKHVLAPRLGMGSSYQSFFDKKLIPIPPWIFEHLRRWHHLSFLKSRQTMNMLREMRDQAIDPTLIDGLIHVVEDDLGYQLYRVVEQAKFALSSQDRAPFKFDDDPVCIDLEILRDDFEQWIRPENDAISACLDRLMTRAGVSPNNVDRVFMTGGTSFVPSVRRLFESKFGVAKLSSGNELTSVASGLALRARELG